MLRFIKLSLMVSEEAKSLVSDFLLGHDATGVAEDIVEGEGFLVSAYFPKEIDLSPIMNNLKSYLDFLKSSLPKVSIGTVKVEDIDRSSWEAWRNELKTVRAGRKIVIRPPWEEYPPKDDEVVIEINPAMAFGTGHHETTRLCIGAMEEVFENAKVRNVLDVGCGSGILAIAALKLGVDEAVGLDIDPLAVQEAKKNSEKNGVFHRIKLFCGYLESLRGKFDFIVANISIEAILLMKNELKSRLENKGKLLVSGIPYTRMGEVVSGLEKAGFIVERELRDGEWVALLFNH